MIGAYIWNIHFRIIVLHMLVGSVTIDEITMGICNAKQGPNIDP